MENGHKARSEWITLNVGGTNITTTRSTLTKDSGSILAKLCEDWSATWATDANGAYLLDSDPVYFKPLLNFLRRGELIIDKGVSVEGVLAEAKYMGIQGVINILEPPPTVENLDECNSWDDIGGLDGVKRKIQQVVDHALEHKETYKKWGIRLAKNVLLYGPPGCGKTMVARVAANQIKANFIWMKCTQLTTVDCSQAFAMLENEFKRAKALAPCIIFLEEFECIAQFKGNEMINHLVLLLDNISSWESIFVFAATNSPVIVEPTLLRPGRFDQLVYVPIPNEEARTRILENALSKVPYDESIDIQYLAKHTKGFSGADLKEVCQRACKFALTESISKSSKMFVTNTHLETAMSYCTRSVTDEDLYKYEKFNKMLHRIQCNKFAFPVAPTEQ